MAILTKGTDFTTGDQVSATNLDNLVDAATFASGAVDNSTTQLSGGAIIVKDGGVTPAKLSTGGPTWSAGGALTAASLTPTAALGVAYGGTGATTASAARTALGLGSMAVNTLSVLTSTATSVTETGSGTGVAKVFNSVGCPKVTLTTGHWIVWGSTTIRMSDTAGECKLEFSDNAGSNTFGYGASKELPTTRDCMTVVGHVVISGSQEVYFKATPVAGSTVEFGSASADVYAGTILAAKLEAT